MTVRALRAGSIRLALLSAALLLPAAPGLAQTAPSEAPQQQEAPRPQSRAFDRVFSGSDAVAEPGRFLLTVFEGQDSIDRGPLGTSLPDGPYLGVNPSVSLRGGSGFSLTSTSDIRRYTDTGGSDCEQVGRLSAQMSGRRTEPRLIRTSPCHASSSSRRPRPGCRRSPASPGTAPSRIAPGASARPPRWRRRSAAPVEPLGSADRCLR